MAKKKALRAILWILSMPWLLCSILALFVRKKSILEDLELCYEVVETYKSSVPDIYLEFLFISEDHRSSYHYGIDPIGLLRSVKVKIKRKNPEGASTIEQQFVRVVTGRYERTFKRKFREQVLAILLSKEKDKKHIASAYLSIAFFGSSCIGIDGLKKTFGDDLLPISNTSVLSFISRLKYPRPLNPTTEWSIKIKRRVDILKVERKDMFAKFIL